MALVYGINSVLEALKAPGARVERVSVERGRRNPRLREIEELARGRRVPIAFEERAWLDRKAGGEPHQGVARFGNTVQALELLKAKGYWIAGLQAEAPRPLWEADFTVPTALVLGGEEGGLHRLVRERCDFLVGIPVRGRVSSHNVSVAAGIALYEVLRQRERAGSSLQT